MHHPAVVSIDLGSAYTKIGIRSGWNETSSLVAGLQSALPADEAFCVPSVTAHVTREGTHRWLIGTEAASQRESAATRVFTNWKAQLFAPPGNTASGQSYDPIEVATAFLRALRVDFVARFPGAATVPARLAVPKLGSAIDVAKLISSVLKSAGWPVPEDRPTVYEPESNALGLLSRGRNATWTPPIQSYRPPPVKSMRMQQMLEPGLSHAFRTMRDGHTVLVTDIGAFTTDFGMVEFDSSFKTDHCNRPAIKQRSVRLGIRQLDHTILSLLEPSVGEYFGMRAPQEWERRKREMCAGRSQRITIDGRAMEVGAGIEAEAIGEEIRAFAKTIIAARDDFQRDCGSVRADEEALTGGGSAIPLLRRELLAQMRSGTQHVHDLWDPGEPDQAVSAGAGPMTAAQKDQRMRENQALVRGGSAIGAASVFFE